MNRYHSKFGMRLMCRVRNDSMFGVRRMFKVRNEEVHIRSIVERSWQAA